MLEKLYIFSKNEQNYYFYICSFFCLEVNILCIVYRSKRIVQKDGQYLSHLLIHTIIMTQVKTGIIYMFTPNKTSNKICLWFLHEKAIIRCSTALYKKQNLDGRESKTKFECFIVQRTVRPLQLRSRC